MTETLIVAVTVAVGLGIAAALIAIMVGSIVRERRASGLSRIWANFGLPRVPDLVPRELGRAGDRGVGTFVQEQRAHQEAGIDQASWCSSASRRSRTGGQVPPAVLLRRVLRDLIHRGSAESKDGTDRIEEAVGRIERRLDEAGIGSTGLGRDGA